MSTYLQLCQSVRAQAGLSGDGPSNVTGQAGIYLDVVRWVDEAYNEIQTLHENWKFLFQEVSFTLQNTFNTFPALSSNNTRQITKDSFLIQRDAGDKERLPFIGYALFRGTDRFLTSESGKPEVVTETPEGNLKFWPTPDADYTIYYEGFQRPDIMEASGDLPIFHAQFHDLIKLNALMKYAEFYNSQEIYKSAEKNFRKLFIKMQFSELPKNNIQFRRFV